MNLYSRPTMRLFLALLLATIVAPPLYGQDSAPDPLNPEGENLAVPVGWEVRLDKPQDDFRLHAHRDSTDIWFVTMTPGWHLTAGPSAIYYHPASTATGDFTAHTAIHLFDPQGRNEGYGLIVGGTDLEDADQAYLYFLIRNDGKYLVKKRHGAETSVVVPWTSSETILPFTGDEPSVLNKMSVTVAGDTISFSINDQQVHELPSADHSTDGVVGLRVNHGLNLHVRDLGIRQDG